MDAYDAHSLALIEGLANGPAGHASPAGHSDLAPDGGEDKEKKQNENDNEKADGVTATAGDGGDGGTAG